MYLDIENFIFSSLFYHVNVSIIQDLKQHNAQLYIIRKLVEYILYNVKFKQLFLYCKFGNALDVEIFNGVISRFPVLYI